MHRYSWIAVALPVTFAVACGRSDYANRKSDVDLQRDLKLAGTSTMTLPQPAVNPDNFKDLETAPQSALTPAQQPKPAAGPQMAASKSPEVKAAPISQVAAATDAPVTPSAAKPAPNVNQDPVARMPSPMGGVAVSQRQPGNERAGPGRWGDIGPIIGVVIRGGGIDGDNCEPHGPRGVPGVYFPPTGGVGSGSRFPTFPHPGASGTSGSLLPQGGTVRR